MIPELEWETTCARCSPDALGPRSREDYTDSMKRILLISYGFPPVSRVQSQGAAKLAKGLAENGWDVHVLTVADPPTYLFDETLAEGLPSNVTVHETFSLEPTRVLQLLRRGQRAHTGADATGAARASATGGASTPGSKRSYTSLPPRAVRALRGLFFPDEKVGWAPWAVRAALRLHNDVPFDAVVSTGPPYTDHTIGRSIARKTGLPWLAVLMDPIVDCYAFPPATRVHRSMMHHLERSVAREAALIATATQPFADELLSRNPDSAQRVFVFPNSFESSDFTGPAPDHGDGFLVSYVGTFQLTVCADSLLDAVGALRDDPLLARDLRVRFVGPLDPETAAAIRVRGLDSVVECTGLLGHRKAVEQMRQADVLVVILGPEAESAGILTGKLPEYLAADRPILAIVPEGTAADTVIRAGAGEVVAPGDPAAIEAALRRLHAEWLTGSPRHPDPAVVAEFDRARNASMLDARLRSACSPREVTL